MKEQGFYSPKCDTNHVFPLKYGYFITKCDWKMQSHKLLRIGKYNVL